jgi:hypothetical protein
MMIDSPSTIDADSCLDDATAASRPSSRSGLGRVVAGILLAVIAAGAGVAGTATTASAANGVTNGYGYAVSKCSSSYGGLAAAEITARVVQDYDGEYVSARIWVQDLNGWHPSDWQPAKNNPGWSADGSISFDFWITKAAGRYIKAQMQYAWYYNGSWRINADPVMTSYTDTYGARYSSCPLY